jgi:hypothetical protein
VGEEGGRERSPLSDSANPFLRDFEGDTGGDAPVEGAKRREPTGSNKGGGRKAVVLDAVHLGCASWEERGEPLVLDLMRWGNIARFIRRR